MESSATGPRASQASGGVTPPSWALRANIASGLPGDIRRLLSGRLNCVDGRGTWRDTRDTRRVPPAGGAEKAGTT